MNLLIIGGTMFLGRHLVDAAQRDGHEVTLFNRGKTDPDAFPDVEQIRGDRTKSLAPLGDREWDAVIDTCGYFPRDVQASAGYLADRTGHYTFISSISVYADFSKPNDESSPLGTTDDPDAEAMTNESYGPLKVLCEKAVEEALPGRTLVVRPGLIVGPYDPSDRYTYWPHRIAAGGEVLVPGRPERKAQIMDCRDLASWCVAMAAKKATGVFNATSEPTPFGAIVAACPGDATITWVEESFLLERKVQPWSELPVWIPEQGEMAEMDASDVSKAVAAGLTFRPLAETAADTLAWDRSRPPGTGYMNTLTREREVELLAEWRTTAR